HYIGEFNYDSELSKQEKDFRVLVRPESWVKIKGICREHLTGLEKTVIDISPNRELSEEFEDSLRIKLTSENYYLKLLGMAIEEKPDETENIRSKGIPTVRVYYIYLAEIISSGIIKMMLANSKQYSDNDLRKIAMEEKRKGGKERVNAGLTLEPDELGAIYSSLQFKRNNEPVYFGQHRLSGNVPVIIEGYKLFQISTFQKKIQETEEKNKKPF
ncbi:MAG: hypothetical protein WAM24_19380, partial [Ignavibacteriaceae bacterium]